MANTLHLAAEGYEVQCPRSIAAAVDAVSGAGGVVGGRQRRQLVGAVK
jgi:hypothetical protein